MPVVFDEVIASVEALPAVESSDEREAQTPERDKSSEKAIVAIETWQRRALRLEAN
jgi:hypothetical protein